MELKATINKCSMSKSCKIICVGEDRPFHSTFKGTSVRRKLDMRKENGNDETKKCSSKQESAMDLIKEISALEIQITYLERYILTLYRKRFEFNQPKRLSNMDGSSKKYNGGPPRTSNFSGNYAHGDICVDEKLVDSSIYRSHSSLSQHLIRVPSMGVAREAVDLYHSLPLSMLENAHTGTTKHSTLADHLEYPYSSENVWETPNRLSEEMLKCISSIYCKLAGPGLTNHNDHSSSSSFSFPSLSNEFNDIFGNTSHIEMSKQFLTAPYSKVVEVQWICRDGEKFKETEPMLQTFRAMICRLEEVYPRKMKHEEKLAFWINIHNALVMHAFLVYGIPENSTRRRSIILKAAYKIGGQTISVDKIQRSILGCQLPRPGQWLRLLFASRTRFKAEDTHRFNAIEQQEPLLHFALTSGSYSDPAVRVYTPKRVYQELEAAKKEYIKMNLQVHKSHKILLPKIVESYAKDSEICHDGLIKMIDHYMPETLRTHISKTEDRRIWKNIDWVSHKFAFRYLISDELVH